MSDGHKIKNKDELEDFRNSSLWDADVTESWIDEDFDIEESFKEAEAWENYEEEVEKKSENREDVGKYKVSRVPKARGAGVERKIQRDAREHREHRERRVSNDGGVDVATLMRGIQNRMQLESKTESVARTGKNPPKDHPKAPKHQPVVKPVVKPVPAHKPATKTPATKTPAPATKTGFRYNPPSRPHARDTATRDTATRDTTNTKNEPSSIVSMWADAPTPAPTTTKPEIDESKPEPVKPKIKTEPLDSMWR